MGTSKPSQCPDFGQQHSTAATVRARALGTLPRPRALSPPRCVSPMAASTLTATASSTCRAWAQPTQQRCPGLAARQCQAAARRTRPAARGAAGSSRSPALRVACLQQDERSNADYGQRPSTSGSKWQVGAPARLSLRLLLACCVCVCACGQGGRGRGTAITGAPPT